MFEDSLNGDYGSLPDNTLVYMVKTKKKYKIKFSFLLQNSDYAYIVCYALVDEKDVKKPISLPRDYLYYVPAQFVSVTLPN